MISTSHNSLSPLRNCFSSPNDKFGDDDSSIPKVDLKTMVYDKIYNYLISEDGLNFDFKGLEVPDLKKAQFDRIQELLTKPFTVKSIDNLFELSVNFNDLFSYLKIDRLEIVGSTVYWILGVEYMREVCNKLNIPEELIPRDFFSEYAKQAADIDVRFLKVKDPNSFKKFVCAYLATLLPQKFNDLSTEAKEKLILNKGLTNFFTQLDEQSKEHFGVISFGNRSDFSVDLLFVENLKRKYLFKHDAVKIVVSKGFKKDEFSASLNSNSESLLESLILRLTKILNTENIEGIDERGACMLFSYLTKGWRYHSKDIESTLISTFLKSYNFSILSKMLNNHYPDEPFASTFICFNACSLMPEDKNLILNIAKQILKKIEKRMSEPLSLFHLNEALMHLNSQNLSAKEAKLLFDGISAYFQIFGLISTALIDSKSQELEISPTTVKKESVFQIKFKTQKKPLSIIVKNESFLSLNNFKNITNNESLLKSLQNLSQHLIFLQGKLKISEIHIEEMIENPIDLSKYAFNFLEDKNCLTNHIGFYLLCYSGIAEKNSSYLNFLIMNLMVLLINEQNPTTKKNLLYSLIKYWLATTQRHILLKQTEVIETLYDNIDKYDIDHKIFCLLFSKFEIREISTFVFNTWEHLKCFDLQSNSQLIENFKDHDPYSALKILKNISEEPSSKYSELKKSFDLIVATYGRLENKLIEERDLLILADIAEQLINKLTPFKYLPKHDEMKYFIDIIRKTVKFDFVKGAKLLKKLEEKNGYNKGLNSILRLFSSEDKLKFVHQLVEQPLDSKATNLDLVERIEQFSSLCTIDSDAEFLTLAGNEILKALLLLFKGKKPGVVKLKEFITPHLGWLLAQLLNQIESDEKPQELVLIYFKMSEAISPQIIFNEKLILCLILGLKTILSKDKTQFEFVKTHLAKLGNRNSKNITEEELQLYHELAVIYLKISQTKIASDYVKIILSALLSQNKPFLSIIEEFNGCFDQFILHKQSIEALLLLEHYENLFSEDPLPNETIKWKELILSFDQKQTIKKLEILSKKANILKKDEEILKIAKEIALSTLGNQAHFKDKTKTPLNLILELIKGFHISDLTIIRHLRVVLKPFKDKIILESFFKMYQGLGVNLSELTPLFKSLSNVNSEIVSQFLEKTKEIMLTFNDKERLIEKKELIQEFISGLLKCKLMNATEIDKTFSFLKNELILCGNFTIDQQNEINLNYCKSFISLDNHEELNIWEKLIFLSLNSHKKEELKELLQLFIKGLLTAKKNSKPEKDLEPDLVSFLKNIKTKVPPLEMLPYFNFISTKPSNELLDLNIYFAQKIIENILVVNPSITEEPYVQFKIGLKIIIDLCFERNILEEIIALGKFKCFTSKEMYSFASRISKFFFEHEEISKKKENISRALSFYMGFIESSEECLGFENESQQGAIKALLSLIFVHDDSKLYLAILIKFFKKINSVNNLVYQSPTKFNKKAIIIANKGFQFIFNLTKTTTAKLFENKDNLTQSMIELIVFNIKNFQILIDFTDKKEEVIALALETSFTSTIIPTTQAHGACVNELQILVKEMIITGYLSNLNNGKFIKNRLQLVAMSELIVSDYEFVPAVIKAKIMMDMISKILKLDTPPSTANSFFFFNQNFNLLKTHLENETSLLLSKFKAVNYGIPEDILGDEFKGLDLFPILNADYGNRGK